MKEFNQPFHLMQAAICRDCLVSYVAETDECIPETNSFVNQYENIYYYIRCKYCKKLIHTEKILVIEKEKLQ